METATIISSAIGVGPVLIEPRLKERHAGQYQGLTREEIEQQFPGQLEAKVWPPGWESTDSVLQRTHAALDELIDYTNGHGDVLAVSHGGVIYSIEEHHGYSHQRIANLGARWLHHDGARWTLGERLMLAPDTVTIDQQDIV